MRKENVWKKVNAGDGRNVCVGCFTANLFFRQWGEIGHSTPMSSTPIVEMFAGESFLKSCRNKGDILWIYQFKFFAWLLGGIKTTNIWKDSPLSERKTWLCLAFSFSNENTVSNGRHVFVSFIFFLLSLLDVSVIFINGFSQLVSIIIFLSPMPFQCGREQAILWMRKQ